MPGAYSFWSAYSDLQHERPPARYIDRKPLPSRIPWSSIAHYARFHGMNVDELKQAIWALDDEIINSQVTAATAETDDTDEETSDD